MGRKGLEALKETGRHTEFDCAGQLLLGVIGEEHLFWRNAKFTADMFEASSVWLCVPDNAELYMASK